MIRLPPSSNRPDPLFPHTTRFRSLRYSVRFLAQPVPEVRGFPLKRRDSIEPLTDQRLGHAPCEGKAHAVEHHFLAITVVQRRDRRRSHGLGNDIEQPCRADERSEEHTSELQSLMRNSYAVFCLKKKRKNEHISTVHISSTVNTTTMILILQMYKTLH